MSPSENIPYLVREDERRNPRVIVVDRVRNSDEFHFGELSNLGVVGETDVDLPTKERIQNHIRNGQPGGMMETISHGTLVFASSDVD